MAEIRILDTPFDADALHARVHAKWRKSGAIVSFLGQVRPDQGVVSLELQHYPGVTEQEIANAAMKMEERWLLDGLCVVHRVGTMPPGAPIVFVAAAATHRRDAFESVDFMMDYLKSQAPFWKKRNATDGASWVEPREADLADAERWNKKEA